MLKGYSQHRHLWHIHRVCHMSDRCGSHHWDLYLCGEQGPPTCLVSRRMGGPSTAGSCSSKSHTSEWRELCTCIATSSFILRPDAKASSQITRQLFGHPVLHIESSPRRPPHLSDIFWLMLWLRYKCPYWEYPFNNECILNIVSNTELIDK